jgi:ubiquinone/menaquinone biosynthesis C-methylase UbiE
MSADPDQLDRETRQTWRQAARGWEKWQAELRATTGLVSRWMLDAINPQPGQRILELAAGPGETGFLAAQELGPTGTLVSSDQSEEMIAVARRRAAELGLKNVEFAVLDAQRLELEPESFDAVLCRWGYMLMGDPAAALLNTRRVLRSGGRFAMATWDTPEKNLWMTAPGMALVAAGALAPPEPGVPGPFAMAHPATLAQVLAYAGFQDIKTDTVEFSQRYARFEQYWQLTTDMAAPIAGAIATLDANQFSALRASVRGALTQFTAADGTLAVPASALVASATA